MTNETNETSKQYAERILRKAQERIARWEPAMKAAEEKARQLSIALDAIRKSGDSDDIKKIAFTIQQQFNEAANEYGELFNVLQDEYKDCRKMSEYLAYEAEQERRATHS